MTTPSNHEPIGRMPKYKDLSARINALEPSERKQKHKKIMKQMPAIARALKRGVSLIDIAKILREHGLGVSVTTLRRKIASHKVICEWKSSDAYRGSRGNAVRNFPPPQIPARTEPY